MAVFRVPYPSDPEQRRAFFEKVQARLASHGTCDGDCNAGAFHGSTPIGELAGRYIAPEGAEEIEIEITKKPFIVPASMIESETRKFVEQNLA